MKIADIEITKLIDPKIRIEIFNTYAEEYNDCDSRRSRIQFTSTLTSLRRGFQDELESLGERINSNTSALKDKFEQVKSFKVIGSADGELITSIRGRDEDEIIEAISIAETILLDEIDKLKKGLSGSDQVEQLKKVLRVLSEITENHKVLNGTFYFMINSTLNQANHYALNEHHINTLGFILNEVSRGLYKDKKLKSYQERNTSERQEISNSPGAPMQEDVPQQEVENIVTEILAKANKGDRVISGSGNNKKAFTVIHGTGKRKGKANVNQIFKYFESTCPGLINISERRFKDRIKKALPDEMT